ncbi:MAG: hypothetical protein IPJ47_17455 [Anaerolineales bacterium]|nr:hypothetical protein [Anaerolineales bacterium]
MTANAALIETALSSGAQPPEAQGVPATEDPALPPTEEVVIPAEVLPPATGDGTRLRRVATNCRQGPGAAFKSIYGMPVGQVAKVVAKNSYSGYWIIESPRAERADLLVMGSIRPITGDTASLKDVVTPTSVTTLKQPQPRPPVQAQQPPTQPRLAPAVASCTDPAASNYNSAATQ